MLEVNRSAPSTGSQREGGLDYYWKSQIQNTKDQGLSQALKMKHQAFCVGEKLERNKVRNLH